jgi:hypothetical protein
MNAAARFSLFALVTVAFAATAAEPKTREEVRAEAASAAKAGQIDRGEVTHAAPPARSTKSRAEVKAETRAAVKAGAIEHGEADAAVPPSAPGGKVKTRAEVKAETAAAIHPPVAVRRSQAAAASAPDAAASRK